MKISEPKLSHRDALPYVGIRAQIRMDKLGEGIIPQLHGEILTWLRKQEMAPSGAPFIRYYTIDMEGLLDIEMGWPIPNALPGNDRIQARVLPAGHYASLVYTGVENGIAGNKALLDWGAEQGLVWDKWEEANGDAFGARFESFLTNPQDEPDLAKWETEVAIRLAGD